jgi:DNA polymerase III epsilon subunit-like protein
MRNDEIFISVDVEASGPIPGEYSMLSIGACCVDDIGNTFYRELKPISDRIIPEALAISGLKLDNLQRFGADPADAMEEFEAWITSTASGKKPVFVGFNASFDWAFVNYYFHKFLNRNPFGIGALDIKAYYMGAVGSTWSDTKSSKIPNSLRPHREEGREHNALVDAQYQAEIFRRLLNRKRGTSNAGIGE